MFQIIEMAVITNLVRATNFHSYIKDLLDDIHCQIHSSYVSFTSGHLSLSVAPYILTSLSPMFKSILLEDPHLCSVTVHPSFSKVFPSLITLLYTGQVTNITNNDAVMLKMLIKDLGILADIEIVHFNNNNCDVKVASHSAIVNRSFDGNAGAIPIPFNGDALVDNAWERKKSIRFSTDSEYDIFEENFSFTTTMCPSIDPEGVGCQGVSSVSADRHRNLSFGESLNTLNEDRAIVDIVFVPDHEVDEIEENVGGSLNYDLGSFVLKDAFCDADREVEQLKSERCNICDQDFPSKYELLDHLAMTHYKAKLAESFPEYGRICPLCLEFRDDHEDNLQHIGRDHEVVYDYYQSDEFVHHVDEFNGLNNERKKRNDVEPNSIHLRTNRKLSDSKPSALKGILKLARIHQEVSPKSILKVPRLESPPAKESILKQPKSQTKTFKNQVEGKEYGAVNVLLSVQNKSGVKIIDLE